MSRSKGITVYGIMIIIFGAYVLLGVGKYGQFALMFKPLPGTLTVAIYLFTVLYGICAVYCGSRILKLEDWARKVLTVMAVISVTSGLFLNRIVMSNFKEYIASGNVDVPPEFVGPVYTYAIILTAVVTVFELSFIYFFTRSKVAEQFS
ncbi:MAG: hypothetical protein P9L88_07260 [Candidatus Tantalella remota]|nr:hypothetical protein [Candidatus Tantalella remota]